MSAGSRDQQAPTHLFECFCVIGTAFDRCHVLLDHGIERRTPFEDPSIVSDVRCREKQLTIRQTEGTSAVSLGISVSGCLVVEVLATGRSGGQRCRRQVVERVGVVPEDGKPARPETVGLVRFLHKLT